MTDDTDEGSECAQSRGRLHAAPVLASQIDHLTILVELKQPSPATRKNGIKEGEGGSARVVGASGAGAGCSCWGVLQHQEKRERHVPTPPSPLLLRVLVPPGAVAQHSRHSPPAATASALTLAAQLSSRRRPRPAVTTTTRAPPPRLCGPQTCPPSAPRRAALH